MNICFRVDSSIYIGTGHVMRCLTLAEELKKNGHIVYFICRLHESHLCKLILDKGFKVFKLDQPDSKNNNNISSMPKHAFWLGVSQYQDIAETITVLKSSQIKFDWIIVDHYAIDKTWEKEIRNHIPRIMVIDDLADREHDCDILLDQNYYKNANNRYTDLVPHTCLLLLGPDYALLRDEFVNQRKLQKQQTDRKAVLVFYGGSDRTNETLKTIHAINKIQTVTFTTHIVVGPSYQFTNIIKKYCDGDKFILHQNIDYMAKLMSEVDFAICAGGSTTWERYCIGTPAILTAVAFNQIELCENIIQLGIDHYLGFSDMVTEETIKNSVETFMNKKDLNHLSIKARNLVNGDGKRRVLNTLNTINN